MTTALGVVAVAMSCLTLGFVTGWTMRHRIMAWQVTQLEHDPEGRVVNPKRR
jgi:hypothetical protein